MLPLYVFALVLGGGFLGVSLFGDALEADVDGVDVDLDGLHVDVDGLHVEGDLHGGGHAGAGGGWSQLLSIRSIIYSLFGFGAVGTILHLLRAGEQAGNTAIFAATGAVLSGALISALFGFVRGSESGERLTEAAYRGLVGTVSLPINELGGGQITVIQGVRSLRLPARVHPAASGDSSPDSWSRVVVVEMDKGVALVAPADPELLSGPDDEES